MVQNLIVALIVIAAALYVARKYLPAGVRQKLVYRLAARGASQSRMAKWLNTETGCGSGCDTCKACDDPAPNAGQDANQGAGGGSNQRTGSSSNQGAGESGNRSVHRVIKLHPR
jgi:hypothetical protein